MRTFALATVASLVLFLSAAPAAEIRADNPGAIKSALSKAGPGDVILVKPGEYDMGGSVRLGKHGKKAAPITFRCEGKEGYAVLKVRGQIGMRISRTWWVLEGIHIAGQGCSATVFADGPGGCRDVKMIDCKISGSKQHGIKSARTAEKAVDNFVMDGCEVFDTAKTGIDLVSGDNWVVRNCYVHDYGKAGGVSYGIFLKGGGVDGIIENCLVDGKKKRITVGISFGGGLTGKKWLPVRSGKTAPEHDNGIARNNVVVNTSDVAYHTNNGANCRFYNNLAYNCKNFQRQASYPKDALLVNNLVGKLMGASRDSHHNIGPGRKEWFSNPEAYDFRLTPAGEKALVGKGAHVEENLLDMFGTKRDAARSVLGPILPGAKPEAVWIDRRAPKKGE